MATVVGLIIPGERRNGWKIVLVLRLGLFEWWWYWYANERQCQLLGLEVLELAGQGEDAGRFQFPQGEELLLSLLLMFGVVAKKG